MDSNDNAALIYFFINHFATAKNAMLLCNNSMAVPHTTVTRKTI
jgi:hypothetical protein